MQLHIRIFIFVKGLFCTYLNDLYVRIMCNLFKVEVAREHTYGEDIYSFFKLRIYIKDFEYTEFWSCYVHFVYLFLLEHLFLLLFVFLDAYFIW